MAAGIQAVPPDLIEPEMLAQLFQAHMALSVRQAHGWPPPADTRLAVLLERGGMAWRALNDARQVHKRSHFLQCSQIETCSPGWDDTCLPLCSPQGWIPD